MEIVNVVELINGSMNIESTVIMENSVRRQADRDKKVKYAEDLFLKKGQENGMLEQEKAYCLENGYYTMGNYELFLCWSE